MTAEKLIYIKRFNNPVQEEYQMNERTIEQFMQAPASQSVRLIDFEEAKVVERAGTYFLIVSGIKPYLNMTVRLSPLIYVRQPEYWGIEVLGSLPGIALPATAPYTVAISLNGILGTIGVEAIGASSSQKINVPEGAENPEE
jgi:hypothetical protein